MDKDTFHALDEFLVSDRAPADCMQLSDLDGFLTGLAVTPWPVSPIELLPVVWGDDEPAFADDEEAEWVINTILDRYDEIAETLSQAPHELTPVFWDVNRRRILTPDRRPILTPCFGSRVPVVQVVHSQAGRARPSGAARGTRRAVDPPGRASWVSLGS